MTTPARYPTLDEIYARIELDEGQSAADAITLVRNAIDIERERVAKEAGEPVVWQYRGNDWKSQEWLTCVERVFNDVRNLPAYQTRALVVQNSAAIDLSPGEYFRCDVCHEPAGTRQVCQRCVMLEIENEDEAEGQNSAEDIYAAYKTWPDDIKKKRSLHDLRRMNGWEKNSAVKVPDDVMADARSLIRMADTGMQCDAARGVLSFLQSLNQSAEKSE